jgi:hypothetical protein
MPTKWYENDKFLSRLMFGRMSYSISFGNRARMRLFGGASKGNSKPWRRCNRLRCGSLQKYVISYFVSGGVLRCRNGHLKGLSIVIKSSSLLPFLIHCLYIIYAACLLAIKPKLYLIAMVVRQKERPVIQGYNTVTIEKSQI